MPAPKGCPLAGGRATLKQLAPYFFSNRVSVQNCSFFKTIGDTALIRSPSSTPRPKVRQLWLLCTSPQETLNAT